MSLARSVLVGLVQAAALALYCWGVSLILFNNNLARTQPTLGFIFFLVLFVFSAVVSAALVLGYPGYLALQGRWRQALGLVGATMGWLVVFLVFLAFVIFGPR